MGIKGMPFFCKMTEWRLSKDKLQLGQAASWADAFQESIYMEAKDLEIDLLKTVHTSMPLGKSPCTVGYWYSVP